MRLSKTSILGLAAGASAQGYQCPLQMPDEVTALEFAYGIQNWLYMFYSSMNGYSADDFAQFPNASMVQSNGMTLAANLATNMAGLTQQAQLGVQALTELAGGMDLSSSCDFSYPPGLDESPMAMFMSAYYAEATLCGAFIGLSDYVQNPAAAFLTARLAAEHGIHGSYLGSYVNPTPYSADSMALTPAFTPEHLLMPGDGTATRMNVGYLGQYIPQGCLKVPQAPCGVNVEITNLTAMLSGGDMGASASATAGGIATSYDVATATMTGYVTSDTYYAPGMATTTDDYGISTLYPAPEMTSTAGGAYGYGNNASYPAGTAAQTSYGGPVAASSNVAAAGADVSSSMMTGLLGMLLAALF